MGNNQSGGPDARYGGPNDKAGLRRHRMMSETAKIAGQVLPNPDGGPPMIFDVRFSQKIPKIPFLNYFSIFSGRK